MRRGVLALCLCGFAVPVIAAPQVHHTVHTYDVTATTIPDIIAQLNDRGPRGHWGYARWVVNWDSNCRVRVDLDLTMPRHTKPDAMPPDVHAIWDDMIRALEQHERRHLGHGISAARQIDAAGCKGGLSILRRWSQQDEILDRTTDHGRLDGVDLQ